MSPPAASPAFLGIDLGTTNSVAVLLQDDHATPVRNADGAALLPSVVRLDARGQAVVGARARKFLEADPENARSEFKRLMGSDRKLSFRAAKVDKSPEELSALVLSTLRASAERALGHAPTAAVITVPALFELPQTRATSEAARLAGFARVEHLQEPVASALTAGWNRDEDAAPWLVYDLGGGTFDVSLLETREGVLRVVDHDGDNFLGGRDMDARLLDLVLARLSESSGKRLSRADPALAPLLRRLRAACEDAKIELATSGSATVSLVEPLVVGGDELTVDVPLEEADLATIVFPIADRTVEVCERLLERKGLTRDRIGRVVLVGGPTIMPALRARLTERLQIALATDVDPMTAVAEGAARFAAEHDLSTTSSSAAKSAAPSAKSKAAVAGAAVEAWLQYPAVSGDLFPYVVGRVKAGSLDAVRLERESAGSDRWQTADENVDADGSFVVQVELSPRATSRFRLVGLRAGQPVAMEPPTVTIRHGVSLADPPVSRSIGIALADGHVAVYFERGAPLPSRKTFRLRTSFTVRPDQKESALRVPVVQGEVELAHLCRLVGHIDIRPDGLNAPLPAGSLVDVLLELDRGGNLTATAHVPDQGISFPGALALVAPGAPASELGTKLAELRAKTEALYTDRSIGEDGQKKLVLVDRRLEEMEGELAAAEGGDADSLEKLRRMLVDADGTLADVEALRAWPELESRAIDLIGAATHWIGRTGTALERSALEEAMSSLKRARAARSTRDFSRRLTTLDQMTHAAVLRDPEAVGRLFRIASGRIGEMRDPRAARDLVRDGERAVAAGDHDGLRRTLHSLWQLLPPSEAARAKAHGSGVER
jgi:molecular chaperone DnaK